MEDLTKLCEKCGKIRKFKNLNSWKNTTATVCVTCARKITGYAGEKNPFYGKKHTDATKQQMKENHADFNGDKNPFKKSLDEPEKLIAHKQRCKDNWAKLSFEEKKKRFKIKRLYGEIHSYYWLRIQSNARSRNVQFLLTPQYVWELFLQQNKKCAISGIELCMKDFMQKQTASLDRIDSSKGYIEGNVQWLHKDINIMKLDHSQEYFIQMCKIVAENNKNK